MPNIEIDRVGFTFKTSSAGIWKKNFFSFHLPPILSLSLFLSFSLFLSLSLALFTNLSKPFHLFLSVSVVACQYFEIVFFNLASIFLHSIGSQTDVKLVVAMAPWFCLRLPSCGPGFESQAHHLCFFQFVLLKLHRENNEIKQKEAGIGPFLKNRC